MADTGRELILASGSRARRKMMEGAGLRFKAVPSDVDEEAVRAAMCAGGARPSPPEIAVLLARAKAVDVSRRFPHALVVGADQILNLGQQLLTKPADLTAAGVTLAQLRGRTHDVHAAVAIAEAGTVAWSTVDTARLTMRMFSEAFVNDYLAREGDGLLEAVGAFRLEGLGAQLFERIEGDYFTILGLPLLPLLAQLRIRAAVLA
jgi:septum formation protein